MTGSGVLVFVVTLTLGLVMAAFVHRKRTFPRKLRRYFESIARKHKLSIHCCEVFKSGMLGIDCVNKKVLYVNRTTLRYQVVLIDLGRVTHCSFRKVYLKNAPTSRQPPMKVFLSDVMLEFDHTDLTTVAIPFYRHWQDGRSTSDVAVKKAGRWEVLIQKLLVKQPMIDSGAL